VLLGSDYPYDMGDPDPVALVNGLDRLDDKERALVLGGNAARLLRLDR
jgi:aminocarboxymuconate-semialdehyde decarboxylase